MVDAPIAAWLRLGPQGQAIVTVSFIGTRNRFVLTRAQAQQLHGELGRAIELMAADNGDSQHAISHKLSEGIDA